MTYQVVAFDLDGTLLNSQGQILPSSKQAIRRLVEKGIKVVLVTGRHHTAARPYHYELQLDTPIICCNGTYLYDTATNSMPLANPLSKAQALQVVKVAEKYQTHLLMYSRDAMNFLQINEHMQKFSAWVQHCPEQIRPNLRQLDSFEQLIRREDEIIWKFVISHPQRSVMEQAVAELPTDQFSCEWSWIDRVDVAKNGNSKGGRLKDLLALWQISPENVIAFGDNHNDISMLNAVGLGVAMGNAEEEVKRQAKLVTLSNDDDGIAQILQQYC
ncbi:pyridoxal phosphatase [Caviibacterium pharyngocola]|uniref:Pyridoxal phosphatase n=1 Tax=Caviibacterium pharyngocola TaxID=28159 RepID=A0A2M8RYR0_9PAST|nr:pyridoxal phosphatase [Caviibacterium pharyngocola]PJG84021.1 pyridoxal phosphatase [Caviibacterium pharyngocola]